MLRITSIISETHDSPATTHKEANMKANLHVCEIFINALNQLKQFESIIRARERNSPFMSTAHLHGKHADSKIFLPFQINSFHSRQHSAAPANPKKASIQFIKFYFRSAFYCTVALIRMQRWTSF